MHFYIQCTEKIHECSVLAKRVGGGGLRNAINCRGLISEGEGGLGSKQQFAG